MKRRTLLVAVGASLPLAGCTSDSSPETETSPTTTTTSTPTETPSEPMLVEASLTPEEADQCNASETTVVFSESKIDVIGCVVGRNGCSGLRLASARYDEDDDSTRLVVETVENREEGEECTEALEPLGYRVALTYEYGVPGEIVVVHDDANGRRTVVEATPAGQSN
ncbi:hypothetical protein ACFQJC_13755 [Haloferax namakaokahaiae]|uniref:Lipoprotein n=1 Tax=Haloferax namakaokahaiae TaxID=1748331 RepID=A0ABD5ZHD4_9EURY